MQKLFKIIILIAPIVFFNACFKKNEPKNDSENNAHIVHDIHKAIQKENVAPVVIIGSGPAGLSASLYIARAGMKSFVFAGPMPCGQLTQTTYVENWPGKEKILGIELMQDIKKQAESFGATIIHDSVKEINFKTWPFEIITEDGRSFKSLAVIVATGATPRRLDIDGESKYWGKGVTTCATCDAPFFKNKNVVVAGGGDSAIEMVFELAPYVKSATILVRKGSMRAAMAMQNKLKAIPNAFVQYHKEITKIYGDDNMVTAIDVYDNETKLTEKRAMDGVFLAIGHDPNNKILRNGVDLDEHGYVIMKGRSQESCVRGVFAAGEIQDPFYRQAIVAAGEGVKAALDTVSFLYDIGFTVEIGAKLENNFFERFSDVKKELTEITTIQELYDQVINVKGVVVLDFYSLVCPCCMQMLPHLEAVAHKLQDKISIIKTDYSKVSKTIYPELVRKHDRRIDGIRLPSLLVFKDGKLLDINTKVMNKREMYDYFKGFLS